MTNGGAVVLSYASAVLQHMLGFRSPGNKETKATHIHTHTKHLVLQSLHPRKFEEYLHTDHRIEHYVKSINRYSTWILAVLNIIRSAINR